ncbi:MULTISPECIES: AMP-binding protein [unclassified Pseudoxanthomonas]|uniref:ApeI family dehydratase n=1 Tax=unclassified Pseudoxanthomonas TaxID=2645906 RepID=UPI00307689A5
MADWISLNRVAVLPQRGRPVACTGAEASESDAADHEAFRRRASEWRAAFSAQSGQDWALYFEDTAEFAAALFGAWHAGKRVYLGGDNLPATLARLQPHVAGFAGDVPAELSPLFAEAGNITRHGGDSSEEWMPLDEESTRLMVFTSGSTGEPVAIEKRLSQLAREVEALQAAFGADLGEAAVHGTVSHQHIYGLLFRVLWPLAAGRAIVPRTFFPEDMAMALARRDSVLVASPAHLKRMPEQLDWASLHGRVRAVFSSGGALPAESALAAKRLLGVAPTEIFGSSETGGIAWRRWNGEQPAWQALPGVHWRVEQDVLEVRSPHLLQDEWWRGQDRAIADSNGGFRLLGRADRIVKIEERRVSLDALERQLAEHDHVQEAKVLSLTGARNTLAAVIVPSEAGWSCLHEIGRRGFSLQLGQHLATSQDAVTRPRRWRFVEALPVNAQGKSTEAMLTALFRPERPQPRWLKRDDSAAELELDLDPSLAAFDGHFPQAAILPGVAQLDWAIRFGREAFALPPLFLRMEALKFQRVARPGDRLTLSLEWQANKHTLTFRYVSVHGPHASGRVVFGHDD